MPENIVSLEIDLETDDLIKNTARARKELEQVTTEVKFLRASLKVNAETQAQVAQSMERLRREGKENSSQFRQLEKTSVELRQTEEKRRLELEKNVSAQRTQRMEYNTLSKALNAYTTNSEKEFKINQAKGGSIQQIQTALNQNRLAYRNLSEEERNSSEIGGELLKTIQQQDEELKSLSDTIGQHQLRVGDYRSQIKLAVADLKAQEQSLRDLQAQHQSNEATLRQLAKEQETLRKSGREGTAEYKATEEQIRKLNEEQKRLNSEIDKTEREVNEAKEEVKGYREELNKNEKETAANVLTQTRFSGRLGNVIASFNSVRQIVPRVGQAIRAFGRVLLANPIYLIAAVIAGVIAALIGLIRIFTRTQAAQDNIRRSTAGIQGAFQAIIGILQRLGGLLVRVFSQPQKILQAYLNVVKQVFNFYKNILTLNFSGLRDQVRGLFEGVTNIFNRVKETAQEINQATQEGIKAGQQIADQEIRLRDLRTDNLTTLAELRNELEEQNTIIGNTGLSEEERLEAADRQAEIAKEINQLKGQELDLEIEILETKFALNDTSAEELKQLETLRARRIELDGEETRTVRRGEQQRTRIITAEQQKRAKENQKRLDEQRRQEEAYNDSLLSLEERVRKQEQDRFLETITTEEAKQVYILELEIARIRKSFNLLETTDQQKVEFALKLEEFKQNELTRIEAEGQQRRDGQRKEQEETDRQTQEEQDQQEIIDEQTKQEQVIDLEKKTQEDRRVFFTDTLNTAKDLLGEESKAYQALSLAKQSYAIAEAITNAQLSIQEGTKQIAEVTADTQAGAAKTLSSVPFPFNLGLLAGYIATVLPIVAQVISAVRTARQLASGAGQVQAKVPAAPSFEKGGIIPIGGKRHSQGGTRFFGEDGTTFEAEQGEALVLNRGATKTLMPYLDTLNKRYGGQSIISKQSFLQTGGTINPSPLFDTDDLAQKIGSVVIDGVRRLPNPVVTVEDINLGQSNVNIIANRANL